VPLLRGLAVGDIPADVAAASWLRVGARVRKLTEKAQGQAAAVAAHEEEEEEDDDEDDDDDGSDDDDDDDEDA
jgi:hypothetical protein